ncbi:MAG: hypothetical protein ABI797_03500 [Chloroflexota bacterium]
MDNDLMARRLRPPSQPSTPQSGQQPPEPLDPNQPSYQPLQPTQPDEPIQPTQPGQPTPIWGQPPAVDPAARADIPWDRPAPEPWPPSADDQVGFDPWAPQLVAPPAQPVAPPAQPVAQSVQQPVWPAADLGQPRIPHSKPPQFTDPYDAMAPVVGDVNAPPAQAQWQNWNGNGALHDDAQNGQAPQHEPVPQQPLGQPEPASVGANVEARPDFAAPPWPAPWNEPFSAEPFPAAQQYQEPAAPAFGDQGGSTWDNDDQAPTTEAHDERPDETWSASRQFAPAPPVDPQPAAPQPEPPQLALPQPAPAEPMQPMDVAPAQPPMPVTQIAPVQQVTPDVSVVPAQPGAPANMVLRIEVAIVDDRSRVSGVETARRVGPPVESDDYDESLDRPAPRHPEFEPRNHVVQEPAPRPDQWEEPRPDQWQQPQYDAPQHNSPQSNAPQYSPPPSAWQQPAPAPRQPAPPTPMDWDLPPMQAPVLQPPIQHQSAPSAWSLPMQPAAPQPMQQPPAPAWATTPPVPAYAPQQAPYDAPQQAQFTPQPQVPSWPGLSVPDPLAGLAVPYAAPAPAPIVAPYGAPAPYAAPYAAPAPAYAPQPAERPEPAYQPEPQAITYARSAAVAPIADPQADLWFLSNQPAAAVADDDEDLSEVRSSSLLTAGLTIGFAILVIVLVLVFIQVMTSILR